tara:strand:+ start:7269 stop:7853 length:585 start_codon:yes stop_codon:yes gene_type:complete
MASDVAICNTALNRLGANTITSFTENSKEARLCNAEYEGIRDQVLRSHPWNCALRRATLAQESDTPSFGYAYQYILPTDPYCLRVLQMETEVEQFKVEGRKLLTDESTAKILYIGRVTDPEEFDSLLVDTLSARIAVEFAFNITGSRTLQADMFDLYNRKLALARSFDAQESGMFYNQGDGDKIIADDFINRRR